MVIKLELRGKVTLALSDIYHSVTGLASDFSSQPGLGTGVTRQITNFAPRCLADTATLE